VAKEFLNPSQLDTVLVDTSPQALLERLHALATQAERAAGAATTDYSRI
jgi:hypothetical protein